MGPIVFAGKKILPGTRASIEVPVAKLYTDTDMTMPVHVIHSKKSGPSVFVSAAIHGDELNGIEIVRRLIHLKSLKLTAGTLYLVPIVNVYGVLSQSRYMPDRRDLNRSFPGSTSGSLAGRLAQVFMKEIVRRCDYGIDLHTGAIHRSNMPQIRADLKDEETLALAKSFGVPVLVNSEQRDGSLRQSALEEGIKTLVYEAGQALRFDEISIRAGVSGVLNVLSHLSMIRKRKHKKPILPFVANNSSWIRAGHSGIVNTVKELGDYVQKGDTLAYIGSPFGETLATVVASRTGVIIAKQNIPLAQEGEAMFHIAFFSEDEEEIVDNIESMQETMISMPSTEFPEPGDVL